MLYAVLAAEGIYSAASPSSTVSDLTRQIKDGPGKVVVSSEDVKGVALSAAREAGLPVRNVLVLKSHPQIQLKSADGEIECDFRGSLDWRRISDPEELENSKACIVYSSGTTGLPKGTSTSHHWLGAVRNIVTGKILTSNRRPRVSPEHGFRVLSPQHLGP